MFVVIFRGAGRVAGMYLLEYFFLGHFFPEEFSFSKAQIWDTAGQDVVGGMGAVIHREKHFVEIS